MRGFTEFRLCRIRARSAPVSAHLSICRNFATVRGDDRASYPRCSHCRCQAANTRLYAHTATVQQHDCANARRRRMVVPRRIAKAARQGFDVRTRIVQRSPRRGPENAHLSDARSQRSTSGQCPAHGRSAVCRSRKASPLRSKRVSFQSPAQLPKNLTVTSAVSKIPMVSNTYALQRIPPCRTVAPRKTSPFRANTEPPTSKFAPEKAHLCRKRAQ